MEEEKQPQKTINDIPQISPEQEIYGMLQALLRMAHEKGVTYEQGQVFGGGWGVVLNINVPQKVETENGA